MELTSLDVSMNLNLAELFCGWNNITGLDVSNNPALIGLFASYNKLTALNVKNGNNINFTLFEVIDNPDLSCIQVDDATWSETNWLEKDATAFFSEDCGY